MHIYALVPAFMDQRQDRIYYEVPHELISPELTPLSQAEGSAAPACTVPRRPFPSRPGLRPASSRPHPRLLLTSERYHFDLEISDDEFSDVNGHIGKYHKWISETRVPYTLVYHSLLAAAIVGCRYFFGLSGSEMLDYTIGSWIHLCVSACFSVRIVVLSVMSLVCFYKTRAQQGTSGEPKTRGTRIFFEMVANSLLLALNLLSIAGLAAYALRIGPFAHMAAPVKCNGGDYNRNCFEIRLLPALMGICILQALAQILQRGSHPYAIGFFSVTSLLITVAICNLSESSSPGLSYVQNYLKVSSTTPWYLSPAGVVACHILPVFFCSVTVVLDSLKSYLDARRSNFWRKRKLAFNILFSLILLAALGATAYFIYCSVLAGSKYSEVYLNAQNTILGGGSTNTSSATNMS